MTTTFEIREILRNEYKLLGQLILHTTQAIQVAWALYLKLGFERSLDLDFSQEELQVFGFRLRIEEGS